MEGPEFMMSSAMGVGDNKYKLRQVVGEGMIYERNSHQEIKMHHAPLQWGML